MDRSEKWATLLPEKIPFHEVVTAKEVEQWFCDAQISRANRLSREGYIQLARDIDGLSRQYFSFDIRGQLLACVGNAAIELERAIDDFEQFEAGVWAVTFAEMRQHLLQITYLGERSIKTGRPRAHWHKYAKPMANLFATALQRSGRATSLNPKNSASDIAVLSAYACARAFRLPNLDAAGFSQALIPRDRRAPKPHSPTTGGYSVSPVRKLKKPKAAEFG